MFKSRKMFYSILIIIAMIFTGCAGSGTVFVDQNDKVLPKTFTNLYIFMDYSADFSDFVGNITADLYSKDFITEQEKNKIGEIWKQHKKYNNQLQEQMEIWYGDIINDTNNLTDKQRIFDMVESIVFESNMMFDKLVKKTEGTGIYIPKHLPNRIFKLHNDIQEDKL